MRILIIGSGGREHALGWALAQSPQRPDLFFAPGNAGTQTLGQNIDVQADNIRGLLTFARTGRINLTIVGPEQPLVDGLVDLFAKKGLQVIGPTAAAARLEGSKAFAKAFMERHGIPTAAHRTFEADAYDKARVYVEEQGAPIVLKASGLAAGKGALVCDTLDAAYEALDTIVQERAFGAAGDKVVIEECMQGEEASVFALSDGKDYRLLAPAQDHKRIGEGDTGPNTGGMGAYAPAPVVTDTLLDRIRREIIEPALHGMAAEGCPYSGVLYAGLMITEDGPKVVEFNCRLGDPEAQVVLPLIEGDLADIFVSLAEGRLRDVSIRQRPGAAACVVMASGGYPLSYDKGFPITGLVEAQEINDVIVFHAGTRIDEEGVVTAGGRVLGVTALGDDLAAALDRAYTAVDKIDFEGVQYRRDIGRKGLVHLQSA